MKKWIAFFLLFLHLLVDLNAQTGPGGVGTTDGSSSLKLWYRVDNGVSPATVGSSVTTWTNSAGISALDITATGGNRPTVVAGPNTYNEISFNGSNKLTTATGAITTSNFVTSQASTFVVSRADNTTQTSCVYTTDPLENAPGTRFSNHLPWSGTVYYDIGTCCNDRIQAGGLSNITSYNAWSYDAINSGVGKQLYQNGTLAYNVAVSTLPYSSHATQAFNIGANTSGDDNGFEGDVTEVIIFTTKINTAQRRIIQNYLSAKYNIALGADDLYTRDDNGFDHDVAGIGRVDASNTQTDSQGTGMVRISGASDLEDNEYLFWGHDNGSITTPNSVDVDGTTIRRRLSRIWRVSEIGGVGTISMAFDLSGVPGAKTQAALRLLIDRDGDGFGDNDRTPISGTLSGSTFTVSVSNANLANGDRFTIGSTNISTTPLPIMLSSFDAKVDHNNDVKITWSTAQEINNDFFTIERSSDGLLWEEIKTVPGSGDSKVVIDYVEFDQNPIWGKSYYRLKQTDFDLTSTHSKVVSVVVSKTFKDILVYPIPADDELLVEYPSSERIILKLTDEMGRERRITPVQDKRGASLPTSTLPPGIYFLYISNGRESTYKKIVIE